MSHHATGIENLVLVLEEINVPMARNHLRCVWEVTCSKGEVPNRGPPCLFGQGDHLGDHRWMPGPEHVEKYTSS